MDQELSQIDLPRKHRGEPRFSVVSSHLDFLAVSSSMASRARTTATAAASVAHAGARDRPHGSASPSPRRRHPLSATRAPKTTAAPTTVSTNTLTKYAALLNDAPASRLREAEAIRSRAATGMLSARWQRFEKALVGRQLGPDTIDAQGYLGPRRVEATVSTPAPLRRRQQHKASRRFMPSSNGGGLTPTDRLLRIAEAQIKSAHVVQHATHTAQRVLENLTVEAREELRSLGISPLRPLAQPLPLHAMHVARLLQRDASAHAAPRPPPPPSPRTRQLIDTLRDRQKRDMRVKAMTWLDSEMRDSESAKLALAAPAEAAARRIADEKARAAACAKLARARAAQRERCRRRRVAAALSAAAAIKATRAKQEERTREAAERRTEAAAAAAAAAEEVEVRRRKRRHFSRSVQEEAVLRRQAELTASPRGRRPQAARGEASAADAPAGSVESTEATRAEQLADSRALQERRLHNAEDRRRMLREHEDVREEARVREAHRRDEQLEEHLGRLVRERDERTAQRRERAAQADGARAERKAALAAEVREAQETSMRRQASARAHMRRASLDRADERRQREAKAEARRAAAEASHAARVASLEHGIRAQAAAYDELRQQRDADALHVRQARLLREQQLEQLDEAIRQLRLKPARLADDEGPGEIVRRAAGDGAKLVALRRSMRLSKQLAARRSSLGKLQSAEA